MNKHGISVVPNPKTVFWILVALFASMLLSPETIVKMMAVYWLGLVGIIGIIRLVAWYAIRKGAVTVSFGCDYRAHSIHCDTLGSGLGTCNCVPTHPVNCGHCA